MPTISMFYGILIRMFFRDIEKHHPHIHADYQGQVAVYSIPDGTLWAGGLPPNKHKLVIAWIEIHQEDLQDSRHDPTGYSRLWQTMVGLAGLMSAPIYSTRRSRCFEMRPNSRRSSMAGILWNGIVGPICQRTRSRHGGRWLKK